jgi:hypothetical protein
MATLISLFGYSVPLTVILVGIALVIGLALAVMFWITIGWSTYQSVKSDRRQAVSDELQGELLDRVFDPDVDWQSWIAGMSPTERTVLRSLLDEYLRELDGREADRLRELGVALDIPARSQKQLQRRGEYTHLNALTWLTLLERPDEYVDSAFEPRTPRERAATVRLLYESEALDDASEGLSLLLENSVSQFTVFGQDTLYRVASDDPQALLETAAANYQTWSQPLLIQVLTVFQYLGTSVSTENLSWLTATLEHESERVRATAARSLGSFGWRVDIREQAFLERLVNDPAPRVRQAVYEMLASWGDEQSLRTLIDALAAEDDARARLVGTTALAKRQERIDVDISTKLGQTWEWSREHAEYNTAARRRTDQVRG